MLFVLIWRVYELDRLGLETISPAGAAELEQGATPALDDVEVDEDTGLPSPAPLTDKLLEGGTLVAVSAMLDQARSLRLEANYPDALLRLKEAHLMHPQYGPILAEMAVIYEEMDNLDPARKTWEKLRGLGPTQGALYDLAVSRLGGESVIGGTALAAGDESGVGAGADGTLDEAGIGTSPGSVMGFSSIVKENNQAPDGETFLTLRLEVVAKEGETISPMDVDIQILFYESINDEYLDQTLATVDYHWVSLPADWNSADRKEILEVDYLLDPAIAESTGERRDYYGYIARIYYGRVLQDFQAEPASLLSEYPPPPRLPDEP